MLKNLEAKKKAWKTRNAESSKSKIRRKEEGWFDKYAPASMCGIDIGCGDDPIHPTFRRYDKKLKDGDAELMAEMPDDVYFTVYASHVLEHLPRPGVAIQNWYRICKPGGHVIICVPHRDLYEKKTTLPSRWNGDHKHFWLPEEDEPPVTRGLRSTIRRVLPEEAEIVLLRVLNEGYQANGAGHPDGEYSIEAVIHKPKKA